MDRAALTPGGRPARHRLLIAVGLAVTVLASWLAFRDAELGEVADAIAQTDLALLAAAVVTFAASIFLRALRWRALFGGERQPPTGAVTGALLIGYLVNTIMPLRAGEAARVVALHHRARMPRSETVGTIVIERVMDVLSLLLLLFAGLPWFPGLTWTREAGLLAAGVLIAVAAGAAALAAFGPRATRFLLAPLARLTFIDDARLRRIAWGLTSGLAALHRPRVAGAALAWTIVSWVVMSLSFWLLMQGMRLGLPSHAALLVVIAIGLAMIVPSSPAAVGVFEAATIAAVSAYGTPHAAALSFALVLHAMNIVPFLLVGIPLLRGYAVSPRRLTST